MKKIIIFVLISATLFLIAATKENHIFSPPASASITITITDNGSATLVDIRDNLCAVYGYTGLPTDNVAKLAFIKQHIINDLINDYSQAKANAAYNANVTISTQVVMN